MGVLGGADCILYGMFSVKNVRLTLTSLSCFRVTASCKAMLTFRGITVHHFIVNLTLFTELLLRIFSFILKEKFQSCDPRKSALRTRIGGDVFQLKLHFWNDYYPPLNYIIEEMKKMHVGKSASRIQEASPRVFVLVWCLYLCFCSDAHRLRCQSLEKQK